MISDAFKKQIRHYKQTESSVFTGDFYFSVFLHISYDIVGTLEEDVYNDYFF